MRKPIKKIKRLTGSVFPVSATLILLLFSHWLHAAPPAGSPRVIPEHYIVVFKDDVDTDVAADDLKGRHTMKLGFRYRHALRGMSVKMSARVMEKLAADPRVAYIEPDVIVSINAQTLPTGIDRINADLDPIANIDGNDDRVDVDIAILDTGIDFNHPDLNVYRYAYCNSARCFDSDSRAYDGNGHGTHVAGIAAALDNNTGVVGVAPGARLWAVKVLDNDGNGAVSVVIAGVDYVAAHAAEIEVTNMSLTGYGADPGLDDAIDGAISAGVVFTLAAGNSSGDVLWYFPAGHPDAITVSALADFDGEPDGQGSGSFSFGSPANCTENVDDSFACFSNHGWGVDIMAPGVNIRSTVPGGGLGNKSGTSMAAPHVAGAAALYLVQNPGASPADVKNALFSGGDFTPCANSADGTCADDPDPIQEPLLLLACEDADGDGVCDEVDNCLLTANPGQEDVDGDGVGDACDNCANKANPNQIDSDSDGIGDTCDNCVSTINFDQLDNDGDDIGDVCDPDDDNDGLTDVDEVNTHGTDPIFADTDDDGLLDGDEVNFYETDPLFTNKLGDLGPRGGLDGLLNAGDITVMTRLITGQITATQGELLLGDLNYNEELDVGDLLLLQRVVLDLIPAP
jgi:subtilisin